MIVRRRHLLTFCTSLFKGF